jgi:hypothetical protein
MLRMLREGDDLLLSDGVRRPSPAAVSLKSCNAPITLCAARRY